MAEFQELIKSFDRIRDYMRQFYIYGFKVRNEFNEKSARTYDNERRRIEGWLSDYTKSDYTSKGKHVYINVDSKSISQNPLYAAWKAKSFTDNDLLLHFFILDLMPGPASPMTASGLCDRISSTYGVVFDSQTVRLKLKEYEALGILSSEKEGRNLVYRMNPLLPMESDRSPGSLWGRLMTAVTFFQEAAPFGFIGSTLLDREDIDNELFQFKHLFIVHTLEDEILSRILSAIHDRRVIRYDNKSGRSGNTSTLRGVPLKIFVSTRTGRRYLCLYLLGNHRFSTARLDSITSVSAQEAFGAYDKVLADLERNMGCCWGVSFGNRDSRLEEIRITLRIDEEKEPHIINRLQREGRGGQVIRLRENEYLYEGSFFDTNEMLSWVKTFTGRVMDIQGSNSFVAAKAVRDWDKMYDMYFGGAMPAEGSKGAAEGLRPKNKGECHGIV